MRKRDHGGLGFAHPARRLRRPAGDGRARCVGDEQHRLWRHDVDLGDHVGVTGEVITTRRAASCRVDARRRCTLTSKSLRPLPDKHKGLTDPEARVRTRYVDLIVRPGGARHRLHRARRWCAASATRCTPAGSPRSRRRSCSSIHGGANARPFETHINAYDLDLYLRIATELHLKRLRRRRHGEGLRDRPAVPQRGRRLQAQPGVHLARGLRDLRRLRLDAASSPRSSSRRPRPRSTARPVARRPDARRHDRGVRPVRRLAGQDRSARPSRRRSARRSRRTPRVEVLQRHAARHRARPRPGAAWGVGARGDLRRAVRGARPRPRSSTPTSPRRPRR